MMLLMMMMMAPRCLTRMTQPLYSRVEKNTTLRLRRMALAVHRWTGVQTPQAAGVILQQRLNTYMLQVRGGQCVGTASACMCRLPARPT